MTTNSYEQQYWPFFDGLRCFSVLWVLIAHLHINAPFPISFMMARGWVGVDIFFVLSGFLITTLLLREQDKTGSVNIKYFFIRRTLRIWPAYYLTIFLYLLIGFIDFEINSNHANIDNVLDRLVILVPFLTNINVSLTGVENTIFLHSWSLALEEQFYLFWPFVFVLLGKHRSLYFAIGVILLCLFWRSYLAFTYEQGVPVMIRTFYGFDTRVDTIMMGCLLALLMQKHTFVKIASRITQLPLFFQIFSLSFIFLIYKIPRWSGYFGNSIGYTLLGFLIAGLITFLLFNSDGKISNILSQKLFVYIGKISFGIYLYHILIRNFFMDLFIPSDSSLVYLTYSVSVILGSILFAHLSYTLFEKRILFLKSKFKQTPPIR